MNASGTPAGGLFKMASGGVNQLAVGADASGKPEVFVIRLDNDVYALKTDGTGSPSGGYLGFGGPAESISVGSDASGHPLLFAIGTDNYVYVHKFDATGTPTGPYIGVPGAPRPQSRPATTRTGSPSYLKYARVTIRCTSRRSARPGLRPARSS